MPPLRTQTTPKENIKKTKNKKNNQTDKESNILQVQKVDKKIFGRNFWGLAKLRSLHNVYHHKWQCFSAQTDASIPDYVYLKTTDEGIFSSHNDAKVSLLKTQPRLKENNK